jgi:hypothetical protein
MNPLKSYAFRSSVLKSGIKAGAMAAAFGLCIFVHDVSQAAETPFAHLAGSWSGQGKITVNATSERIRCRGTYRAGETGTTLALSLRCASDSYKFELGSDITYTAGGAIAGSWNEATRSVYGQLAGRVSGSNITAQASAVGFNASLSILTKGNSQNVSIRSPGSEISEVMITMTRAGR